jgi:hypothetical protein
MGKNTSAWVTARPPLSTGLTLGGKDTTAVTKCSRCNSNPNKTGTPSNLCYCCLWQTTNREYLIELSCPIDEIPRTKKTGSEKQLYTYNFGSNANPIAKYRKQHFKGRICEILAHGKLNSVEVQFIDNNETIVCSRHSIRPYPS